MLLRSMSSSDKTPQPIPYDEENVFLKIIQGKLPCHRVFETEHAMAFLDAFPVADGHALLVPKKQGYASVMEMPAEEAALVLKELPRLCRAVRKATNCEGVNIVANSGKAAGQVVFHAHIHVVPRFEGDGAVKMGSRQASAGMLTKEQAEPVLERIKAALDEE